MKTKRVIALLTVMLGMSAALVGTSQNANAATNSLVSNVPIQTISAQAYNLLAVGALVNIPPTTAANCGAGQAVQISAPTVAVPNVAEVNAISSTCLVPSEADPNVNVQATATAAKVSLLGGAIVITGLRSQCFQNPQGFVTAESTIATLNGAKVALGAVNLTVPGIASIQLNQSSQIPAHPAPGQSVTVRTVGVSVQVLPFTKVIAGHAVSIPAQTITIDTCSIVGLARAT